MSGDEYLRQLLAQQDLTTVQLDSLRLQRETIQRQLSVLPGSPRFYYAGSFGKRTMIRESFDLDLVAYWPHDCGYPLRDIYDAVGQVLRKNWTYVTPKTVAWELPFQGGFHIDVVPGRAIDKTFTYANLYRRDTGTSLQTSIKVHIDTVRNSGRQDVIRLMKLWRAKRRVPFKQSLALELMSIDGSKGLPTDTLERQMMSTLGSVRDNILMARIVDPANTNNVLSSDMTSAEKYQIQTAATAALTARHWGEVLT